MRNKIAVVRPEGSLDQVNGPERCGSGPLCGARRSACVVSLWRQALHISRKERSLAHVADAAEPRDQALCAKRETTVWRHAVL